ncbi:MAG TPA: hypothetical protein VFZ64_07300 [Nocardioidaceae bacterium]
MAAGRSDHPTLRSRLLALAAVLGVALASLLPGTAVAGPPVVATELRVESITTPGIALPDTPGTAGLTSYVTRDVPFEVRVGFYADGQPAPLSENRAVDLRLTVTSGPDSGRSWTVSVPKGSPATTFTVALPSAANGVTLAVQVVNPRHSGAVELVPAPPFDVLYTSLVASAGSRLTGVGGGGGEGVACDATPEEPICADLLLPSGSTSPQFLSLGACDGTTAAGCSPEQGLFVQVLAALDSAVYTRASPATLVVKCDKTLCGGGAISSSTLLVNLDYGAEPTPAAACPAKGVVGEGQDFCVDYVESNRSNAGDTWLYLRFVRDAKVRWL